MIKTLEFPLDDEAQKIANKIERLYKEVTELLEMEKVNKEFIKIVVENIFNRYEVLNENKQ
jgi:peptidoglycan hydrolase CwlO-like protein